MCVKLHPELDLEQDARSPKLRAISRTAEARSFSFSMCWLWKKQPCCSRPSDRSQVLGRIVPPKGVLIVHP